LLQNRVNFLTSRATVTFQEIFRSVEPVISNAMLFQKLCFILSISIRVGPVKVVRCVSLHSPSLTFRFVSSFPSVVSISTLLIIRVYSSQSYRRRATVLESPEQQNVFPVSILVLLDSSVLIHEGPKSECCVA